MIDHWFVSRPRVAGPYVHGVERRMACCDVAWLIEVGVAGDVELGLFRATSG